MNKIINWTIGSFFRTIGRIIAYIGIGIVITYILNSGDFNWGGITELFLDKVKADSQTNGRYMNYYSDSARTSEFTYTNDYAKAQVSNNSNNITNLDIYFGQNISVQSNESYILIPIMLLGETYNMSQNNARDWICKEWLQTDFDTNGQYNGYECKWVSYEQSTDTELTPVQFKMNVILRATQGHNGTCTIQGNMAKCFLEQGAIYQGIRIQYNYSLSNYTTLYVGVYRALYSYYDSTNAINDSINSQTQQQQQQHEQMLDSNTTEAENEATSFFEDFDAPDIGGLGAIITAPLNTIRSLLNSSCTNLTLPLPFVNENLTLPCMNTIYTQHFGAFFTIYQTIILAIIAYRCIRSIFFDIHGFTNPNDDRIEVMDL